MGQALYRKHRVTSLSEIIGQEHITQALDNAITTDRISHAYLFTGARGTGKTSIARILAHAVNDLPYSTDAHLDIIEIDAASNRRIDEIRDLRDKVYIAPTSAKYKVYIIDEVHMLTKEAFNALLKTLEEPPAHVIFILATTDAHKLPETIISRTQRYSFRPVESVKVAEHLRTIAKTESIVIDDAALQLLAAHGEGTFRDSISMLDQVSNQGAAVTIDDVRRQLGMPPESAVDQLLQTTATATVSETAQALQALYDDGYRAPAIAEQLASRLRSQIINGTVVLPTAAALQVLEQLLSVAGAHNPERYLEIILLQAVTPATVAPEPAAQPEAVKPAIAKPTPAPEPTPALTPKATVPKAPAKAQTTAAPIGQTSFSDEQWASVLGELKKKYNTVYGIVRMAKTDFSQPNSITLGFAFAFHQKRINDAKNKKIITDIIADLTGQHMALQCTKLETPPAPPRTGGQVQPPSHDKIKDIASVFGGGELL